MNTLLKICLLLPVLAIVLPAFVLFGLYLTNDRVQSATEYGASPALVAPPEPFAESATLKIVTFNVQGVWVVGRNRPARMRHIGRVLTELDPDIVGFQESFIQRDRAILIEALADSRLRYHEYYPSATLGSGLFISSAWPIQETWFRRFSLSGPPYRVWEGDFWAGKGVALARIKTPYGLIDLYNTHAQAGYGRPEYREKRIVQMRELAAFVNASRAGTAPAFLVGDMNCRIGQPDFERAVADAGLERAMTIESGIDHIFAVRDERYDFETLDTVRIWESITEGGRTFDLSDHAGFMSLIRVTPRS